MILKAIFLFELLMEKSCYGSKEQFYDYFPAGAYWSTGRHGGPHGWQAMVRAT